MEYSPAFSPLAARYRLVILLAGLVLGSSSPVAAQPVPVRESDSSPPGDVIRRVEVTPLADHQVALTIEGLERLRWHFGRQYPRPFFFPLKGPGGATLTRMGHPGAENHDHHRSIWFAHQNVDGVDFWSDRTRGRIRQKHWYAYQDGEDEALMAVALGWLDAEGTERMSQDVVAALLPGPRDGCAVELQLTFRCGPGRELVELGKTNFGFLAVRVARSLSVHFGDGIISDSNGLIGEEAIFGGRASWMDYSGPVAVGTGSQRRSETQGITYFDHPDNPRYPTRWHVREDGWMGASFCMDEPYRLTPDSPLVLRYLLVAHAGAYQESQAKSLHEQFAARPGFVIEKSSRPHRQYEVRRRSAQP